MTRPKRASIEAAPNFLMNLAEARRFLVERDEATASELFRKLRAELSEMAVMLAWAPGAGRPARFMSGRSVQARLRARRVAELAQRADLPHLRECVIDRYVVLYAHSATQVALLALKHQRQLSYTLS